MIGRQVRSAAIQLFDDDSDVLMTEMPLLLDKVSTGPLRGLPGDNAIEAGQGLSRAGGSRPSASTSGERAGTGRDRAQFPAKSCSI